MAHSQSAPIEHPQAYANAIHARIIQNARTTYIRNTPDFDVLFDFIDRNSTYENGHMVEGKSFMSKMAYSLYTYGKLTTGQTEAVRKCMAQAAARKAEWADKQAAIDANRKHLGSVGEKIALILTIKKIIMLEGMSFGYYDNGITPLYIMEDADKNVVIYKGKSNDMPRGDSAEGATVMLTATVKEHGVRNNTKQTIIQRPKVTDVKSVNE